VKVAVSALGPSLDDKVDERFGRAALFLVVDDETLAFDVVDNSSNRNALQGAGLGAAEAIAQCGAISVVTGHLGPKAFRALELAGIAGFCGGGMLVREAVVALKQGRLPRLDEGEAHAGIS
jgi:predicted Fe-Mo cluster-binding NifX family protein